jgi:hypothetical protein
MVGHVVLVEVTLVVGSVDDRLAGRNGARHAVAGEAAADPEDHVGLAYVLQQMSGDRGAAGAEREGVVLGERALGLHGGHDGRLQQLGQLEQVVRRLRVQDALPGVDHRLARRAEGSRRRIDLARVGAGGRGLDRPVRLDQRVGHLLAHDVRGDLDHHRAGAPHAHEADRSPHDVGHLPGGCDGLDGLGHRGVGARRAEQGEHLGTIARVPQRQQQHRRGVGVRRGHTRKRVLGARPVLHAEGGQGLAVLHPRVAVGDTHAHALLTTEHRPDVGLGGGLDERRRGIGAQELGPLDLENARDRIDDFHGDAPWLSRCLATRVDERRPRRRG